MSVFCFDCMQMSNAWCIDSENDIVKFTCCKKTLSREEAIKVKVYQENHYFLSDGREIIKKKLVSKYEIIGVRKQ